MVPGKIWWGRLGLAGMLALAAAATEDIQVGSPGTSTEPGGNANANASSADLINRAQATGGAAAAGSGLSGGGASATAQSNNTVPGVSTLTSATALGGAGGVTYDTALHPPGGAATASASANGGALGQIIQLLANAMGGNSGACLGNNGVNGNAGQANASVFADVSSAAQVSGQATATGGTPNAQSSYPFPNGSGAGGHASASGSLVNTGGDSATLEVFALGGNGGNWNGQPGAVPTASAGSAGNASVTLATAEAASTVTVRATAQGGNGGGGYRAAGGIGGSATVVNAVGGRAADSVTLIQDAIGGIGGSAHGTTGARGGDATSRLELTTSTRQLTANVSANAGRGGETSFIGGNGAAGTTGAASSILLLENAQGAIAATARAATPDVTWVAGSTSSASATVSAISRQAFRGEGASAVATADAGRSRTSLSYGFGQAGSAAAQATAQSTTGNTTARATATGGSDLGQTTIGFGGDATAMANALNLGSGSLVSEAIARGGGANFTTSATPVRGHGGDATATATGQTVGTATVSAQALAGQGATDTQFGIGSYRAGLASATAQGTASGGTISATASTVGARLPVTTLTTASSGLLNGSSTHLARATVGVPAATQLGAGAAQGAAFASGAPVASDVSAAFAGNPTAAGRFDLVSTNQRLLLASFGAGHSSGGTAGVQTSLVSLAVAIDLAQIPAGEQTRLQFALLGSSSTGAGFSSLRFTVARENLPAVDVTFVSLSAAQSYFADQILDLGALADGVTGTLDLQISLQLTTAQPGDAFATTLFVANAPIPEPAAWAWLLLGGAAGLGGRLKQQASRSRPA